MNLPPLKRQLSEQAESDRLTSIMALALILAHLALVALAWAFTAFPQ